MLPAGVDGSMLEIHGSADGSVPLAAAESAVATWRRADHCSGRAQAVTVAPVTTKSWRGCVDGADVSLVEIAGAEHPWPGGRTPPPTGETASTALDATTVAWAFLSSHSRRS